MSSRKATHFLLQQFLIHKYILEYSVRDIEEIQKVYYDYAFGRASADVRVESALKYIKDYLLNRVCKFFCVYGSNKATLT